MDNLLDGFGDPIDTGDPQQASPSDRDGGDYSFAHFDINDYVSASSAASMSTPSGTEQQQQQSLDQMFDNSNHNSMHNTPRSLVHDAFQQYHDQRGQEQLASAVDLLSATSSATTSGNTSNSNPASLAHGGHSAAGSTHLPVPSGSGSAGTSTPNTSTAMGGGINTPLSGPVVPGVNSVGVDSATEHLKEQLAKQLQLQHLQQLQNQLFQQQVRFHSI